MTELMAALTSWAVLLSGYPAPAVQPELALVDHAWLVAHACGGRECRVYGWYPHDGGNTVYLDGALDPEGNLLATSVVVHEITHLLQQSAGAFAEPAGCAGAMALEREAYAVQREFLHRYGVYQPVGVSITHAGCERDDAIDR